jgi:membrane peptidoglycan carboxypeptidase
VGGAGDRGYNRAVVSAPTLSRQLPRRHVRRHAPARRPTRPPGKRHFLIRFWWLWAVPIAGAAILIGAMAYVYARLPLNLNISQEQTSYLYSTDGRVLTTFEAGVDRTAINFNQMPDVLLQAVLAAEDEDYYEHSGVDMMAIVRAAWSNLTGGQIEQGASTITQQYVRNVYPEVGTEVTIERKIKEILLAIKLERALPKNEILRRYLNTVYLGKGAYGMEAAAETYFGVSARAVSLPQAAVLAGVISGPELFNPVDDPRAAVGRRNWVFDRMIDEGFITEEQAAPYRDDPIETVDPRQPWEQKRETAYFIDYTRRYLEEEYGGKTFTGGLQVKGTLNREWQEAAVRAIETNLSLEPGTPQAALVAVDVDNGEVRAMVGGKNFARQHVNLATGDGGTGRQSGSAFKAFTLMAAIEEGISLNTTYSGPSQIDLSDEGCPGWDPTNYSDSGFGTMNLISATANSVNTIFAQLVVEVGPEKVAEVAHRMGIRSPLELEDHVPCSITLGTLEVTPLEMTEAFATFASGGVRHPATPVHSVKDAEGNLLEKNRPKGRRVLEEEEALQAIYAMENVVCCGTGTVANDGLSFEIFGKTGTTDDDSDVWFCGSNSEVAACVWVGHPEGRVSMPGATGGEVAAPIWNDFMLGINRYLDDVEPFPTPELTGEVIQPSIVPIPAPSPAVEEEPEEEEPEEEPKEEKTTPPPPPSPPAPPPPSPPPTTPPPSP